jgi:hypothetical protein
MVRVIHGDTLISFPIVSIRFNEPTGLLLHFICERHPFFKSPTGGSAAILGERHAPAQTEPDKCQIPKLKSQMKDWGRSYASVLFCHAVALLIGSGYQKLLEVSGSSSMTARSASTIWHWDFVI